MPERSREEDRISVVILAKACLARSFLVASDSKTGRELLPDHYLRLSRPAKGRGVFTVLQLRNSDRAIAVRD